MWRIILATHFLLASFSFAESHHEGAEPAHHAIFQRIIEPSAPLTEHHDGRQHRMDGPMVAFPLARPSPANIADLCRHLGHRRVYGRESLPKSGFSHLHRQGDAINRMEAGYATCCRLANETERLACAMTVWRDELTQFCEKESMVKTRQYHCCVVAQDERQHCFARAGEPHGYGPVGSQQAKAMVAMARGHSAPMEIRMPEIAFPPAEPNQHNIHNICHLKKFRPHHDLKTMPQVAYNWLLRRAKAVNQMEAAYNKCCQGPEALDCAHEQWMNVLSEFCNKEFSVKDKHYHCCKSHGQHRLACFRDEAPYPKYDHEIQTISLIHVTELTMRMVCLKPLKVLSKMPASHLVRKMQKNCCSHETMEQRVQCGIAEKTAFADEMCGRHRGDWKDRMKCCSKDAASCLDSHYLAHVQLAKRKRY
uniref:extracellular matrix protein 1 n=1 Tax=Pristiophorus japonicus TaxID=55135 RepID=UPI00398F24F7